MTTDDTIRGLEERLKDAFEFSRLNTAYSGKGDVLYDEAADALRTLTAQLEEARAANERLARENDELRAADRDHLAAKLGMESRLTARAEAAEARLEELTRERDEAEGQFIWLAQHRTMELAFTYDDEESEGAWTVHERWGNRNDMEWHERGRGKTPIEAVRVARAFLHQGGSDAR